jgi:hypothetical protein
LLVVVFSASVPNETLVLLRVSAEFAASSVSAKVFDTPPVLAVSVAVCVVLTAVAVAVKLALVAPAAIVTDAGTVTAVLLLARVTAVAVVAAEVSVTAQASVPAPVSDPLLQESALSAAGAWPVPLRLMVAVVALLLIVTDPLNEPAAFGSKLSVSTADWPGFSVMGKPMPVSPKEDPATDALVIVSAAVPDDVSVIVLVVVVFSASVPNATLVELKFRTGVVPEGVSCSTVVTEIPFEVAVRVTVCGELTEDTVAVKGSF